MAQVRLRLSRRAPNEAPYVALREALIAARKRAGLTQQELADLVGRPQSFIAKAEVGERYLDGVELIAILKLLNADFGDIASEVLSRIK